MHAWAAPRSDVAQWPGRRAAGGRILGAAEPDDSPAIGAGPTVRDPALARLEAVLFLAREPLSTRKLARLANLTDGTRARTLLRRLAAIYNQRGAAFQVEEVAGGFQLLTRRKFGPWLRRLDHTPGELRLSGPALETLAVVAYRQPVLRADIEAIRGVQCGEILRQLMERDLVRIAGRADELGRPFLYGSTKRFLQVFGLRNRDELPRAEEFRNAEIAAAQPVANLADEGNDSQFPEGSGDTMEKEFDAMSLDDQTKDDQSPTGVATLSQPIKAPVQAPVQAYDEDELEDDEEFEDDDEFEDDEDDEDDDEDDELEDDELEDDELEGDWEEVDDEDEDDDDDDDDDDDLEDEEDDEEYEYDEDEDEDEDEYEEDDEEDDED
jgi:segregation and condensation protein B